MRHNQQPAAAALYDAHNHAHDARLAMDEPMWSAVRRENVRKMVVNGASEQDWPEVLALAREHSEIIPSFGYHPWYIKERSAKWDSALKQYLDETPSAVGEIGLDRWVRGHDLLQQEEVFLCQMRLAAERNLPVSIHCLQAWGRLFELLKVGPRPECGFVLHSFGGPPEMVETLAKLGAYFSLPGYFAHERKARQRETFRQVPQERFLIETDAPDQSLPSERVSYPLAPGADGKPRNHPANLGAVYRFASELLGEELGELALRVEENFKRLFGRFCDEGTAASG